MVPESKFVRITFKSVVAEYHCIWSTDARRYNGYVMIVILFA
jgi:hypothetical protein